MTAERAVVLLILAVVVIALVVFLFKILGAAAA